MSVVAKTVLNTHSGEEFICRSAKLNIEGEAILDVKAEGF